MTKVDILFLTAQFLNIDLHLSIYMDLILMNKPPISMNMYSVKYMHHPMIPKLLQETSIQLLTKTKIN